MHNLLVTGGCGFIGTNFILYMSKKYPEINIINVDKLTYAGNPDNLNSFKENKRYFFYKQDICNFKAIQTIVKKHNIDTIVHFAAESHVDRSIENSAVFIQTNVLGTHTLLEVARLHDIRFHHVSTDEVYGSLGPKDKFNETTPYDPRSPYSASKAASDFIVRSYFHTHGLKVTISNCSNNYGPYQFPEKLLPLFITNLIEGKNVPIYGKGLNIRDWLHVEDHCIAIDMILRKGKIGETYCIGGNSEKRNIEIAKLILSDFKLDNSYITYVADRKGHDFRYAIDSSKIQKELGWKPNHNFRKGITTTIRWYRDNPSWWKPLKNNR
jgi:dTDP-glucose 4,6-dehydratase